MVGVPDRTAPWELLVVVVDAEVIEMEVTGAATGSL